MSDAPVNGTGIGARVPRKEDARLLGGYGRFVGDIQMPRQLEVAFLRSPVAHARLKAIRVPTQFEHLVFTAAHLEGGVQLLRDEVETIEAVRAFWRDLVAS